MSEKKNENEAKSCEVHKERSVVRLMGGRSEGEITFYP